MTEPSYTHSEGMPCSKSVQGVQGFHGIILTKIYRTTGQKKRVNNKGATSKKMP
jgi:hypothetical protein